MIDQTLVKNVVDSFVSLGIDDTDSNKQSLDVYKEKFETLFIEATEKYYKTESEAFLAENSVSDYPNKAEERLKEEEDCVDWYLNTVACQVLSKCEDVLIHSLALTMREKFQKL